MGPGFTGSKVWALFSVLQCRPWEMGKARMPVLWGHPYGPALCLMALVQLFEDELLLLEDLLPNPSDCTRSPLFTAGDQHQTGSWNTGGKGNRKVSHLSYAHLFIHVQYLIEPSSFVPLSSQGTGASLFLLTSSSSA